MQTRKSPSTSGDKFKSILDHIVDGVVVQDAQTNIVYINPAATRLLGFESTEAALAAGRPGILQAFSEIYDDDGQVLPVEMLPGRLALHGEPEPVRVVRVQPRDTPSGEWRWAWVKASPIDDASSGAPAYVVTVFQEITEMKQKELGLKAANQRIVNLLEQVLDPSSGHKNTA